MSGGDWHVLVKTYGGTVSLLKGLTEDAARETVRRLTPAHRRPPFSVGSWEVSKSDVATIEAFGPGGRELSNVWGDGPTILRVSDEGQGA